MNLVQEPDIYSASNVSSISFFPPLTNTNQKVKKLKHKLKSIPHSSIPSVLNNTSVSSFIGRFLKYISNNNSSKDSNSTWIVSLASSSTRTLTNSINITSSLSILNSLIESTVIDLLSALSKNDETY